ncbi:MAG: DUF721 domain-containing protein [Magnetovibrio sp.]|nr:DUF721 domain-containing protein [Magnetovibrio sp.]
MSRKPRKRFPDRASRTETLATTVSRLTKRVYGRRGLADGAIAQEWPSIVGELIAKHSQPDRITYPSRRERIDGLLHLRVDHSAMATELQHLEPQLLERINGYFGYKAVGRLKFIHGPIADRAQAPVEPPARPPSEPAEDPRVDERVAEIEDPELRDALKRLGNAVAADPPGGPAKT